jgi:hypothetical protein
LALDAGYCDTEKSTEFIPCDRALDASQGVDVQNSTAKRTKSQLEFR